MQEDTKRKQLLFVDDDRAFLTSLRAVLKELSGGQWTIRTATNHLQAFEELKALPIDTVIVDLEMPVMDGIEFLRLLRRSYPSQCAVILARRIDEVMRQTALDLGAALFLEKPTTQEGFRSLFTALDALAGQSGQSGQPGFSGVMRRVGLADVIQMECLARKSSILAVAGGKQRGRVFISEGEIIHAELGRLQGEMALYSLLGLTGGEFTLEPFTEPQHRTISGQYQFLLMEAARLRDEATPQPDTSSESAGRGSDFATAEATPVEAQGVRIEEVLLCSSAGEVLYEFKCESIDNRLELFKGIEQQARQASKGTPSGRFHHLSMESGPSRLVVQIQPSYRLLVRSSLPAQPAKNE